MPKKNLLLVDRDEKSLRVLEGSLKKAGFNTTTASQGEQDAYEKVQSAAPDLIICDVGSVENGDLDGLSLCLRLRETDGPDIPFIFLKSPAVFVDESRARELGVEDFLTKPIFVKELTTRIKVLLQRRERPETDEAEAEPPAEVVGTRFHGQLSEMGLVDLLQNVEPAGKSGVMRLERLEGDDGLIFFRDGRIVDAELGRLLGEEAIYRMLGWTEGRFEVEYRPVGREDLIGLSVAALLEEGTRYVDAWVQLCEQLPSLGKVFEVDREEIDEHLGDVPEEIEALVSLFNGRRSLGKIVDDCEMGGLEALNVISKLYFEGLLHDDASDEQEDEDADEDTVATGHAGAAEGQRKAEPPSASASEVKKPAKAEEPEAAASKAKPAGKAPVSNKPLVGSKAEAKGKAPEPSKAEASSKAPEPNKVEAHEDDLATDEDRQLDPDEWVDEKWAGSPAPSALDEDVYEDPPRGKIGKYLIGAGCVVVMSIGVLSVVSGRRHSESDESAAHGSAVTAAAGERAAPSTIEGAVDNKAPAAVAAAGTADGGELAQGANPAPAAPAAVAAAPAAGEAAPAEAEHAPAAVAEKPAAVEAPAPAAPVAAQQNAAPPVAAAGEKTPAEADASIEEYKRLVKEGKAQAARERPAKAIPLLEKALALQPHGEEALIAIANAYLAQGDMGKAATFADRAVAANSHNAETYLVRGNVQQSLGHNSEAKSAYQQYLKLAPHGPYAPDLRHILESL